MYKILIHSGVKGQKGGDLLDYKFAIIRKPEDVLHYGKKGMKKGVRRYQREDGTWTDEGLLERYEREQRVSRMGEEQAYKHMNWHNKKPEYDTGPRGAESSTKKKNDKISEDSGRHSFFKSQGEKKKESEDKEFKTAAEQKEKKDKKFKTAAEKKKNDKNKKEVGDYDDDDDEDNRQSNQSGKDDLKNRLKKMENLTRSSENASRVADRLVQKSIQKDIAEFKSKLDLSNMTDNDLRTSINRIRLEEDYKNLVSSNVSVGKRRMRDLLSTAGDITVAAGSIVALALAIKELRRKD